MSLCLPLSLCSINSQPATRMKRMTPPLGYRSLQLLLLGCPGGTVMQRRCVCVWEGRDYVGKKMEENVIRELMKNNRGFPFTTIWFVVRLSPLYLSLSFSQHRLKFQNPKTENEMRKLFIRFLELSQCLTNCLGQQHVPWVSGLKHFVTLKIFTWRSRKSSMTSYDMVMSTSLNIKKKFIIYTRSYATGTDLLSAFI